MNLPNTTDKNAHVHDLSHFSTLPAFGENGHKFYASGALLMVLHIIFPRVCLCYLNYQQSNVQRTKKLLLLLAPGLRYM